MACSCKKKKLNTQTYDFNPTTKPLQSCYVCASKHISFALALLKRQTIQDTLIAIGQLQAATYHYNLNKTELSSKLQRAIDLILEAKCATTQQVIELLQDCVKQAMTYSQKADTTQQIVPSTQYSVKEALKHACLAYTLMYTQLFYEQINKPYAIGQLILTALHLQEQDRQAAKYARQIWKVLQQVKVPNDQDYNRAKTMLLNFMQRLRQSLIIIV